MFYIDRPRVAGYVNLTTTSGIKFLLEHLRLVRKYIELKCEAYTHNVTRSAPNTTILLLQSWDLIDIGRSGAVPSITIDFKAHP